MTWIRPADVVATLFVAVTVACGGDTVASKPSPTPLPPLLEIALTTEQTLVPTHDVIEADLDLNPQVPATMTELLADGFGEVKIGPGEPLIAVTLDDLPPPAVGASPVLLARFVHLADAQLVDDESPARFASLDIPLANGPYRPHEGHGCRILNAAVRSINALHAQSPIDFVLLGGDNVDNAHQNEHEWLRNILNGAPLVECDSGVDNDPTPGADNDPKDPFVAEGLAVPWLWVTGNHDVLVQGLTSIDGFLLKAVGSDAPTGTRDWSLPGGPVVKGEVPPDPKREPITVATLLEALAADGDGHGIDADVLMRGKASYVYDLPDAPIRIVVIDMAWPAGGTEGVVTQSDIDDFIGPAIEAAQAEGRWVVLASHHSSNVLATSDDVGAQAIPADQLTTDAWQSFLAGFDNVLVHLTGHSHIHRVRRREPSGGGSYFELITSALIDYPHQMRVIELWDQDNGFVSVRSSALDFATDGDPVAADGRARGVADLTSGWAEDARGDLDDRNVELWIPKPLR